MVKVVWAYKNIFMNYDEPAYITYDTEGATARFKIYETWDSNQAIYLDDTATNTNRSGKGVLQLWSENPHGTPPTGTIAVYEVIIEVYDTLNVLKQTLRLKYAYTRKDIVTINIKDEKNTDLPANIHYLMVYNNEGFFKTYYGATMTLPSPPEPSKAYLEILRIKDSLKYYMIDRFDRIATAPGTYNVSIKPRDKIVTYFDVEINNTVINTLMSIPGLSYVTSFLFNITLQLYNYGLVIGNYIKDLLGLRDYYVVKVEKVSDSPLVLRFYYETDIAPILVVLILGLAIAGTVIAWIITAGIRDIRVAEITYETQKLITESYNQYIALKSKVLDYCKEQPDPAKCNTEIMSTITPPPISNNNAKENQDDLTKTIETLKSFLILAIVVGVVLAVVSYLRK